MVSVCCGVIPRVNFVSSICDISSADVISDMKRVLKVLWNPYCFHSAVSSKNALTGVPTADEERGEREWEERREKRKKREKLERKEKRGEKKFVMSGTEDERRVGLKSHSVWVCVCQICHASEDELCCGVECERPHALTLLQPPLIHHTPILCAGKKKKHLRCDHIVKTSRSRYISSQSLQLVSTKIFNISWLLHRFHLLEKGDRAQSTSLSLSFSLLSLSKFPPQRVSKRSLWPEYLTSMNA
jgi:hypothetical protein